MTGLNDQDEFSDPQPYDMRYAPPGTALGEERSDDMEATIGSYDFDDLAQAGVALGADEVDEATSAQYDALGADVLGGDEGDDEEGGGDDDDDEEGGDALGFAGEDAVIRTVAVARERRRPAPPMRVTDVDAPPSWDDDWYMAEVVVGAEDAGYDAFPLLKELLKKCGADVEPRNVRVDTHGSYRKFRAEGSPELAELRARVAELEARVAARAADPRADDADVDAAIDAGVADVGVFMGQVAEAERGRRVEPWLAKRFRGGVKMWFDPTGEYVCTSLTFDGGDGELRVMTSLEPFRKALAEVSRYAAEARVSPSAVLGYLPAMAGILAGATAAKEMARAAREVAKRPEVARRVPFEVRIEPKASPAFCALCALAYRCRSGDAAACAEWDRLGAASPAPLRQAMKEALAVVRQAAGAAA